MGVYGRSIGKGFHSVDRIRMRELICCHETTSYDIRASLALSVRVITVLSLTPLKCPVDVLALLQPCVCSLSQNLEVPCKPDPAPECPGKAHHTQPRNSSKPHAPSPCVQGKRFGDRSSHHLPGNTGIYTRPSCSYQYEKPA
jgi:hypothetical protein